MDHTARCHRAAEAWDAATATPRVLVGFDGFVDAIIDVVDKRHGPDRYDEIATIAAFGERISAAAGHSANFELVVRQTKIGGNGPIMANALLGFDHRVTYAGIIGDEAVDPVFASLAEGAEEVVLLGPPAGTDALEFNDGKLMLGKLTPMDVVDFDALVDRLGHERLRGLLAGVDGVATVNWTMTLSMTTMWRRFADEVLSGLREDRPLWFIDLADPAKRTTADLREALEALQDLQAHVDVVLGMNGSEGRQVQEVLGGSWSADRIEDTAAAEAAAAFVQERLGLHCAMVHLIGSAAACRAGEATRADGFRCDDPLITTGAGDHFNSGFFASLLAGLDLQDSLLVGGATSGSYVRSGHSPSKAEVARFLRSVGAG